jgi:hypothetical protein
MRYLIVNTLLVIIGFQTNCQTLQETEIWLENIIETHQFSEGDNRKSDVIWSEITAEVDFSNSGYLFISEIRYFKTNQQPALHRSYVIPIKHMRSIRYIIEDEFVAVEFSIKSGQTGGQNMILKETYDNRGSVSETKSVDRLSIILNRSFLGDNLPNRFRKAVNHLIELNGGEIEEVL